MPGRVERDLKIVCGHWSALGLTITQGVHAIDTGAVWGGKLTALQLDTDELRVVQVPGIPITQPPKTAQRSRPPRRRQRQRGGGGDNANPSAGSTAPSAAPPAPAAD
ncbi:hypothetical protein XPN_2258 [Xanthomonas arboricola pv. pruni MAFF 301427]|nr:hypothetical protein XPN_2258 [Xanthomonas arboricola pv. pruni MAFF 301427]